MAKSDLVVRLIQLMGTRDFGSMRKGVEAIIADERANNREGIAKRMERALGSWPSALQMFELPHNISQFVWPETTSRKLGELYLASDVREIVKKFLRERKNYDVIHEAGLPVQKTLLMSGPPGNGKTSLASAIANELAMPMISVRMHSLITSYMGESSKNLGNIFDYVHSTKCVLFIDEFDAVGIQRGRSGGENGREHDNIVTTLLTNMDRLPDQSIMIAATNMLDTIDNAIRRRFDAQLWLDNPSSEDMLRYMTNYETKHDIEFPFGFDEHIQSLSGSPWSEVERACIEEHKTMLLMSKAAETVS